MKNSLAIKTTLIFSMMIASSVSYALVCKSGPTKGWASPSPFLMKALCLKETPVNVSEAVKGCLPYLQKLSPNEKYLTAAYIPQHMEYYCGGLQDIQAVILCNISDKKLEPNSSPSPEYYGCELEK